MKSVARCVRDLLAEGGPGWSFVLICRREADEDWGDEFLSCTFDGTVEEALDMLETADNKIRCSPHRSM